MHSIDFYKSHVIPGFFWIKGILYWVFFFFLVFVFAFAFLLMMLFKFETFMLGLRHRQD